jgi:hypothetical protein
MQQPTLLPHQILQILGFNVPAEGVPCSLCDMTLLIGSLSLVGSTIDLSRIPDAEVLKLRNSLARQVAAARGEPPENYPATEDSTKTMRTTVEFVIRDVLGFQHATDL